jgi:hypothetical protein
MLIKYIFLIFPLEVKAILCHNMTTYGHRVVFGRQMIYVL